MKKSKTPRPEKQKGKPQKKAERNKKAAAARNQKEWDEHTFEIGCASMAKGSVCVVYKEKRKRAQRK